MTQYQKDILFMESLVNIPKKNYLLKIRDRSIFVERLRKFLSLVGSPEKKLKFIHIAGTSGKGTTTKLLEHMISDAGLKTGSFTSPFATTSIEKISINHRLISPKSLHEILKNKIKPALDKYLLEFSEDQISYFECFLVIALLYFVEQKCDWVIIETGMGGEHDASNVIVNPKVTAITNIAMDHIETLGPKKSDIAKNKAGIIKRNSLFLTTEKDKKLLKIFKNKCKKEKAWFINLENLTDKYQASEYFATRGQKNNLNLVLNILDILKIKPKNSQKVINNFHLICRQETIQKNPRVILDGSHNPAKLGNLIEFLKQQKFKKLHLIIGFAHNKSYRAPLKKLLSLSNEVYLTRFLVSQRKSANLRDLHKLTKKIRPDITINMYIDPYKALASALKKANKNDLILI
ncbi:MAG: Mur ligase family protein, partial [bacterium]|nr:Mur ligase family protein [bacterium]